MSRLSERMTPLLVRELKRVLKEPRFSGLDFSSAMTFLLTDGILPASGLPAQSFLDLEDWVRTREKGEPFSFTATELKNKTGAIIESVLQGNEITIRRHGRPIAIIRPIG